MALPDEVTTGRLMLAEYERIKEEQRTRIGFRDNLLYATFAAMAGVIAVAVSAQIAYYLLLLPPISAILGWSYLVNDEKISSIGRYVRDELAPRLSAHVAGQTPTPMPVFGWEIAHRADHRRVPRKYLQLAADLLTFCGAPLGALVVYWCNGPYEAVLVIVSIVEAAVVGLLAAQIAGYADLDRMDASGG
ncbi:hypothetical protein E1293_31810 [Actinomadura darangshiensis]|uniref:Uncharacterized protein n=1 Tax=Actinomadura darangshiensis TaxID=705336 RepID=A0A4V2YTC0_9ACTN|nr:hypothetical protein [Actinomadura darangshiensis]TDD73287.1 hypothetical protein E1293_31810 [Actinomadura darangshiensis]